jgi:hypothetical protein
MLLLMSVRVNQKLKLLPFDLQTPTVSPQTLEQHDHFTNAKNRCQSVQGSFHQGPAGE